MKRWIGVAVVATALFLSGCGSDGGQANPNEDAPSQDYDNGVRGTDHQVIETYDANVEVQAITVDGVKCVLATRNDNDGFALACPGYTTTTGVTP
jgi:hypothetical protein